MEKRVKEIIFRRLTAADFEHIHHVGSHYEGGGGQAYIDFPTKNVSLENWASFLGTPTELVSGGRPSWKFTVNSLGVIKPILLKIYNRRTTSVSIASQKLESRQSNRIPSWHPNNGFPTDYNARLLNLVVYLVKTYDDEYWAGWFLKSDTPKNWFVNKQLLQLFTEDSAGYVKIKGKVFLDTDNAEWAFYSAPKFLENQDEIGYEKDLELLDDDTSVKLQTLSQIPEKVEFVERIFKIRKRNSQIVKQLKQLYEGKCQLTGEQFTFQKKDGELYSEVHHLIPLGEDGSDNYENMVVVSPLIHRMFHYASVSPIDLSQIKDHQLSININGSDYIITWHPEHSRVIEASLVEDTAIDDEDESEQPHVIEARLVEDTIISDEGELDIL